MRRRARSVGGCDGGIARRAMQLLDDVNQGHKIARTTIQPGEPVLKWGQTIGFATCPIEPGRWVHSHNMAIGALAQEYEKSTAVPDAPPPRNGYTFQGYRRADGRAGTRNYIAILSNVNCSASVARYVAARFTPERLRDFPQCGRRVGVFARQRLRDGVRRRASPDSQPRDGRHGAASEHRRIRAGGIRLRDGHHRPSDRGSKAGADRRYRLDEPEAAHRGRSC